MSDNAERIFEEVAKKHGYGACTVEWHEFQDVRTKWGSKGKEIIQFRLSDYIKGMSDKAYEELAEYLFDRMEGGNAPMGESFRRAVTSPRFATASKKLGFASRNGCDIINPLGTHVRLKDELDWLVDNKLLTPKFARTVSAFWSSNLGEYESAHSVLLRCIAVNKKWDNEWTGRLFARIAILRECLIIMDGLDNYGTPSVPTEDYGEKAKELVFNAIRFGWMDVAYGETKSD